MPHRHGGNPGAIPGSRTNSNKSRTSLCSRVSKTQLAWGSTRRLANFHGVVADKQCTCPASRLMWERYPPTPPAFARCDAAGESCRAAARRAKAGFIAPQCAASAPRGHFHYWEIEPRKKEKLIKPFEPRRFLPP